MAPTSDERREVAARLREMTREHGAVQCDAVAHALGLEYEVHGCIAAFGGRDVAALADLIDPTCEVMEVPDNDEFMIRVVSGFMCKRCGHEAIVERNCDGSAEPPNYCPHCGARVTDGGEG